MFLRQISSRCGKCRTFSTETEANGCLKGAGRQLLTWFFHLLLFWIQWGKKKNTKDISWQPHILWIYSPGGAMFAQTTLWCSHRPLEWTLSGATSVRAPQMLFCFIKAKVLQATAAEDAKCFGFKTASLHPFFLEQISRGSYSSHLDIGPGRCFYVINIRVAKPFLRLLRLNIRKCAKGKDVELGHENKLNFEFTIPILRGWKKCCLSFRTELCYFSA